MRVWIATHAVAFTCFHPHILRQRVVDRLLRAYQGIL
jgi:hypothetical protein